MVDVQGFWMSSTPVTQAHFEVVAGRNPARNVGVDRPIEMASWFDAIRYCNRLSELEGLPPEYAIDDDSVIWGRGTGYRLPTEAEWEYACRAGTTTRYWSGDTVTDLAAVGWFNANSDNQTHPVGALVPNAWGLYDVHGNVCEWTFDSYGQYAGDNDNDSDSMHYGMRRVARGGAFWLVPEEARSAFRGSWAPNERQPYIGFRLARSMGPENDDNS